MAKSKPTTMKWKPLLQSIADCKEKGTRYAFLLGAGASINSGIPGAKKLATDWLNQIEDIYPDEYQKLVKHSEYKKGNIAALYSEVYRVRFQQFPGNGYRAIEDIMSDKKKVWPSIGYSILAQVMNKTRHNLVLTTNFDRLTETALLTYQNIHARVIAHETLLDVAVMDDQHPSIAKVHRDMLYSPMSTEGELKKLDSKWPDIIKEILRQYHVIVIGYGGNDGGLMEILGKTLEENSSARIYWCYRDKPIDKFKKYSKQVEPVKITSFDEMMYVLGEKLDYPLLSDQLIEVAEKRKQVYEDQIAKLVKETKTDGDKEVTEAIIKLVVSTWGEVDLKVQETNDPDEKEALYRKGLEKFPESHQLWGNFALFLDDIRKDYDQAEQYYKKALELDPGLVNTNVNYAIFLKGIRKDYDEAEKYYKNALEADQDNVNANISYAIFLKDIRKDYDEAEQHYKKALAADPDNANNNGNYAGFLLAEGRMAEAVPFLQRAEKNADNKDLELELHFYRLAHFPETAQASREAIHDLLGQGERSPGWDLSRNIERAGGDGCTYVDELRELAKKISEV